VAWRYQQSGHVPHQGHDIEYQGQPTTSAAAGTAQ
jgi:hypothetical protein